MSRAATAGSDSGYGHNCWLGCLLCAQSLPPSTSARPERAAASSGWKQAQSEAGRALPQLKQWLVSSLKKQAVLQPGSSRRPPLGHTDAAMT